LHPNPTNTGPNGLQQPTEAIVPVCEKEGKDFEATAPNKSFSDLNYT
jgi:hypothetical protein